MRVHGTKRTGAGKRTAETRVVKLGEGLRSLMAGRIRCGEEELVPLLLAQKRIKVVQTFKVEVQTMTGHSFDVVLESGSSATVGQLKAEIEREEGTPACRQDLFMLGHGTDQGSAVPLADDFVISDESCTIALCVAVEPGQHALLQAIFGVLYFSFSHC